MGVLGFCQMLKYVCDLHFYEYVNPYAISISKCNFGFTMLVFDEFIVVNAHFVFLFSKYMNITI